MLAFLKSRIFLTFFTFSGAAIAGYFYLNKRELGTKKWGDSLSEEEYYRFQSKSSGSEDIFAVSEEELSKV